MAKAKQLAINGTSFIDGNGGPNRQYPFGRESSFITGQSLYVCDGIRVSDTEGE